MPLIDALGLKEDGFTRAAQGAAVPSGGVILPLDQLASARGEVLARGDRLGAHLPNTAKLDEVWPLLDDVALVSIDFPSFADGRGFSLARGLRRRGFGGTLRAFGPLIADQLRHALGCGFDEVETPEAVLGRQPIAQWTSALQAITLHYQRGSGRGSSILDHRRAAREASHERRLAHALLA
ncbi:MAG: DUF934 domain-containing protein [Hyphomicrobiales bacterium]|nr:DUF934 domain-containing protein [Hyphomicrobiales bacterium]MBV9589682.1 DUF934 domain-containing protein [Hyphomicrobiales bacterium]MBV9976888.1 DUF934 domain-containing protein [Hyphomicrobiales bacterium]